MTGSDIAKDSLFLARYGLPVVASLSVLRGRLAQGGVDGPFVGAPTGLGRRLAPHSCSCLDKTISSQDIFLEGAFPVLGSRPR